MSPSGEVCAGDVVVEDGRILDVGIGLDGDEAVDVAGKHLLPGLFDCHIHLGYPHLNMAKLALMPFGLRRFTAVDSMRKTLECGITTVRDAGGLDVGTKLAVEQGIVPGPRMQIAIAMMSQTGGHGDRMLPSGIPSQPHDLPGFPNAVVDGPEEVRRAVRELIREGADVLKVATSGGVMSPRTDPRHAHFQADELEMMREVTAAADMHMMAHAQATDGIKNAVRADFRSIEHGVFLDEEAVAMMVNRGTWLVPTLIAPRGVLKAAEESDGIPEASIRKATDIADMHMASARLAIESGVKVAMGTDCPVSPHGDNLEELTAMVDCGMTPNDALYAATQSAADLMSLGDELGSIEPGKIADLVVIDGDPLEFENLKDNIDQVWKAGDRVL